MHNSGSLDSQTADLSGVDGGSISLGEPRVDGSVLQCEITASGQVARFLTGDPLRVDYNQPIDDVPAPLLTVPALAQVCPLAWATAAEVSIDHIDSEFLVALQRVRAALERRSPELVRGGEIQYETATCPDYGNGTYAPDQPTGKSALLFDGGVDSLATFIAHRWESPTLVSLHQWECENDPEASRVVAQTESFARRHGCETAFVRSNVLSVLDIPALDCQFGRHFEGSWYNAVGGGVGVLGLCAPLCATRGIERLLRAASRTRDLDGVGGTHPAIDNEVRWSETVCRHDGADLTRQEKVERIADFVWKEDPTVTVRGCPGSGGNCNRCEACARTIVGLTVAGLDPRDHGYAVTDETFSRIRAEFNGGQWDLTVDEQLAWETIQSEAPEQSPVALVGADDFFEWFAEADFSELGSKPVSPLHKRITHTIVGRSLGSIYRFLSPITSRF